MKHFLCAVLMSIAAVPAMAADVGVSVSVGQPGFYGHIELGNFPRPRLIYPEPVLIHPVPVAVGVQPVYIHVPPGHERHWARHCRKYDACGRPVYFVEDGWYNQVYVPQYRREHGNSHDHHHGKKHGKKGKGHKKGRDD